MNTSPNAHVPRRAATESPAAPATRAVRVHLWPRWFDNPYLPNLIASLRTAGVEASSSTPLYLGACRLRAGDWLHLHWPGEAHVHRFRLL